MNKGLAARIVAFVCVAWAPHVVADEKAERSWQCSSEGLERRIVLYRRDSPIADSDFACSTVYTKNGESEVLWQARNDRDYCEPRVLALVEKLQNAGFQCTVSASVRQPRQIDLASESAVDDTAVMVPATQSDEASASLAEDASTAAEFRTMLEAHYEGSYLDAMVAAMPAGFIAQQGTETVSREPGEHLHVAPPNNFVKTMADGSYVLVNTVRFVRGATSAYVNFGFRVNDQRFRFLGYATTGPVTDIRVLDTDPDKVVVSIAPAPVGTCVPARRTRTLRWQSTIVDSDRADEGLQVGDTSSGDCDSD